MFAVWILIVYRFFFFVKQKTAYEMRISDWSSDVCSSDLGFRTALLRGFKDYAELTNTKKASQITADDIVGGGAAMLSVFIKDPQFQGQTKDRQIGRASCRERVCQYV